MGLCTVYSVFAQKGAKCATKWVRRGGGCGWRKDCVMVYGGGRSRKFVRSKKRQRRGSGGGAASARLEEFSFKNGGLKKDEERWRGSVQRG